MGWRAAAGGRGGWTLRRIEGSGKFYSRCLKSLAEFEKERRVQWCLTRARGSGDLLAVTRVLWCHGNGVPGPPLRKKFRSRWRHGLQLLLCGVGGSREVPGNRFGDRTGRRRGTGGEPTLFGTQVPFRVGTFSTRDLGFESPSPRAKAQRVVVVVTFLMPSSPTLVPNSHPSPPGTRVRGSRSSDHTG